MYSTPSIPNYNSIRKAKTTYNLEWREYQIMTPLITNSILLLGCSGGKRHNIYTYWRDISIQLHP